MLIDEKHFLSNEEELTPIENLENAIKKLKQELKFELNNQIMKCLLLFEKLVIDLLNKWGMEILMELPETKKSSDGGIDGIVYQDVLGLDNCLCSSKKIQRR